MSSYFLNRLQIIKPKNCFQQSDLSGWIAKAHQKAESFKPSELQMSSELIEKLFLRYGVKEAQIAQRYFECSDVYSDFSHGSEIYPISKETPFGVDIAERARFFTKRASEVFEKLYDLSSPIQRPDHLIHVTCTGYESPSAAQKTIAHKNWGASTAITHAYHMGCYASIPAVRLAKALAAEVNSVDIVHNEMCGLHMETSAQTPEQMVVQTLFADGHAKYSVSKNRNENGPNFKILGISEKIIPDSEKDMTWLLGPWGMNMSLSRDVPPKIKAQLDQFSKDLFLKAGVTYDSAMNAIFAIHPGGPRIIDAVQETLKLASHQAQESRKVLLERGNMSSATLPHVWDEVFNNDYPKGTLVVSYAFGPGLTLFGAVFEVC